MKTIKDISQLKKWVVELLGKNVVWQLEPKIALARALANIHNPLFQKTWPLHKALYYGPTGSGKTELCKSLAELLFDDKYGYTHINCETMQHGHEIAKLFWAPPWYIGYEKEALLSENKIFWPYESAKKSERLLTWMPHMGIIVFDEIEKAHRDVSKALMSILDEGMIYLNNGKQVDIRNCFVLMTSNIGEHDLKSVRTPVGFIPKSIDKENVRLQAIQKFFSPEFLGRLDGTFEFEKIEWDGLHKITYKLINTLQEDLERITKKNVSIKTTEALRNHLVDRAGNSIRDMERYFNENIRNRLGGILESNGMLGWEKHNIEIDYNGQEVIFMAEHLLFPLQED